MMYLFSNLIFNLEMTLHDLELTLMLKIFKKSLQTNILRYLGQIKSIRSSMMFIFYNLIFILEMTLHDLELTLKLNKSLLNH
jgi:hypothetical protein